MSKAWIRGKRAYFARDVMRDFCLSSRALHHEFEQFDQAGAVSFEKIRDLIGEEMNKGLLWRLKDTAHHLFRNDPANDHLGRFLDWGLGYIFHEAMKLKEDAYQIRTYAPWLQDLQNEPLQEMEACFSKELLRVISQTDESIQREIRRIRLILTHCRSMLPIYYARHRENALLARFFFEQNDLAREVFREGYDMLMECVYENEQELMYLLAAQSLRRGGWVEPGLKALAQGLSVNPRCPRLLQEKREYESFMETPAMRSRMKRNNGKG